jgi:hypothetical protein
MMHSRTHRRRASARNGEIENGAAPSILETFLNYFTDRVARSAMLRMRHGAQEVVRWTVLRLILGWTAAAFMTASLLLLLGAGVRGLEALHCSTWLAYLLIGVFALLSALVAMKGILWPRERREDD